MKTIRKGKMEKIKAEHNTKHISRQNSKNE